MAQSFGTRVFRGFVMTATAGAFQAVLHFGSLIILARLMEPAAFGLVYPISAVFMILTAFLTAGIEQAMVQRREISEDVDRAVVQLLFGGSLLAFVVVNAGVPFVIDADTPAQTQVVIHVLTLLLPVHAARAYAHGWLSHVLDFRRLAILSTLHNVLFVALAVALAVLLRNPLALAVPMVAQWLIYLPFCRRAVPLLFRRPPLRGVFVELLRFGGPMTGATIAQNIVQQVDQMASGFYAAEVAGLYNRASMLANVPGRISNMMAKQLGLAALSKLRDQPLRLAQAYRRGTALLALMGLPATVFMLYHASTLIEVILGPKWLPGVGVFVIIALTVHVRIFRRLPAWVIVGTDHPWPYFYCEIFFVLSKVALCFTLGMRSIELLAVAVLIAHTVECLILAVLSGRYTPVGLGQLARSHAGGLILGLILLVLMFGLDQLLAERALANWQLLAIHALGAGFVTFLLVASGLLRQLDEDHRWVSGQIEDTMARILRVRLAR